jgi:hypothetical protein
MSRHLIVYSRTWLRRRWLTSCLAFQGINVLFFPRILEPLYTSCAAISLLTLYHLALIRLDFLLMLSYCTLYFLSIVPLLLFTFYIAISHIFAKLCVARECKCQRDARTEVPDVCSSHHLASCDLSGILNGRPTTSPIQSTRPSQLILELELETIVQWLLSSRSPCSPISRDCIQILARPPPMRQFSIYLIRYETTYN